MPTCKTANKSIWAGIQVACMTGLESRLHTEIKVQCLEEEQTCRVTSRIDCWEWQLAMKSIDSKCHLPLSFGDDTHWIEFSFHKFHFLLMLTTEGKCYWNTSLYNSSNFSRASGNLEEHHFCSANTLSARNIKLNLTNACPHQPAFDLCYLYATLGIGCIAEPGIVQKCIESSQ